SNRGCGQQLLAQLSQYFLNSWERFDLNVFLEYFHKIIDFKAVLAIIFPLCHRKDSGFIFGKVLLWL
ncbi:MAG TPA: hypothetical protein PLB17_04180, partial [Comamonas denitrificans]|nr:hypothetical protein [Comamonas denitrificans]